MSASRHLRILSVRLPETDFRRFKSIAAARGISLQQAVHEALESWAADRALGLEPLDALQGSLAGHDVQKLRQDEKEAEFVRDSRWR